MRIGLGSIFMGLAMAGSQPVTAAKPSAPPYLRTGRDLINACDIRTVETANYCAGMYEVFVDRTEGGRWKDKCPPIIHEAAGTFVPGALFHVLDTAKAHPEWLDLPIDTFVDKVERLERCNGK